MLPMWQSRPIIMAFNNFCFWKCGLGHIVSCVHGHIMCPWPREEPGHPEYLFVDDKLPIRSNICLKFEPRECCPVTAILRMKLRQTY